MSNCDKPSRWVLFASILLVWGCESNDQSQGGGGVPSEQNVDPVLQDCSAAIMLVLDASLSMDNPAAGSSGSIWDAVQNASIDAVEDAPANLWAMGITTFPEGGAPLFPIVDITDQPTDTRQQLVDALEQLAPFGTFTYIVTAGYEAGFELVQQLYRSRFMIVMSDGEICNDCAAEVAMANYLKSNDIFIISIGHNLDSNAASIMREMASSRPDGTKAYIETANADELTEAVKGEITGVCQYVPAILSFEPSESRQAAGGSTSHILKARHNFGPDREYELSYTAFSPIGGPLVTASIDLDLEQVGGPVSLQGQTIQSGPSNPSTSLGKIIVRTDGALSQGYYVATVVGTPSIGPTMYTLASIYVPPYDLDATVSGPVFWDSQNATFNGQITLELQSALQTGLTVTSWVRTAGSTNSRESDWNVTTTPNSYTAQPGSPVPVAIQASPPTPFPSGGPYEILVTIIGETKVTGVVLPLPPPQ